jgi:hypothetical protein
MRLDQGSRGAPPPCIQLISVVPDVLSGLDYGTKIVDPLTRAIIHIVGSMFVNNTVLYYWVYSLKTEGERVDQIEKETNTWGNLPIATGGCLTLEKSFRFSVD